MFSPITDVADIFLPLSRPNLLSVEEAGVTCSFATLAGCPHLARPAGTNAGLRVVLDKSMRANCFGRLRAGDASIVVKADLAAV